MFPPGDPAETLIIVSILQAPGLPGGSILFHPWQYLHEHLAVSRKGFNFIHVRFSVGLIHTFTDYMGY